MATSKKRPTAKAPRRASTTPTARRSRPGARLAKPKRRARSPRRPAAGAEASGERAPTRTVHTPALDRALEAVEVKGYLARLPPPLQPMVERLRAILLESAPEALEFLEHQMPAYFARGVFARIEPSERAVLVRFLRGGSLPSSSELKGLGEERTLKLSSLEELKAEVLQKLVREAVSFNLAAGDQTPTEA